jgi:alpha-L-rhamnosidase
MMGGFSYVQALRSVATMAGRLDRAPDAEKFQNAASAATRGFHARFWNITSQSYGSDLSGMQMLTIPALSIEAMPDAAVRERVVNLLRTDLYNRSGHHLQTGAVTSKWLLSMLSQYGMHTSALRVASQRTEPGWGWWLEQGATSCWEKWPGDTSRNHIFL